MSTVIIVLKREEGGRAGERQREEGGREEGERERDRGRRAGRWAS